MSKPALPINVYNENLSLFQQKLDFLKVRRTRIGWLRLLIVLATIIATYSIWHYEKWVIVSTVLAGLFCFLYILSVDADNKQITANTERLLAINNDERSILTGDYSGRDDGKLYEPPNHPYARDLDIFGTASVYQYVSRCTAEQSKLLFASHLAEPQNKAQILQTQQAVKELAPEIQWRQQFQSYGIEQPLSIGTQHRIINWLQQPAIFQQSYWFLISIILPVFVLSVSVLYAADIIGSAVFSLMVFICFMFSFGLSKKIHATYLLLSKTVEEINTMFNQLRYLESKDFKTEFVIALKHTIKSENGSSASEEILKLRNILNRFDMRLNIFAFFFLNTFLLWDLWQMLALNKWKDKNRQSVPFWFNAIAEIEVVSSLASLTFNQPAWCFPEIADPHFTLQAKETGHPLIAVGKRVDNSINIQGTAKIALITGSNMGGKSTFLRSIGVNIVLALMGAPVCAESFVVSPVRLVSSMRIADNLAENTSTFYAELKKLQQIIEAVNREENIFILLDEILRGTNSLDRHTGSKALIKQLVSHHAVAIIATHDVELTILKNEFPQSVDNYHFDVQVDSNSRLFFDFKLKDGVCTSLNASIMMKKIGIEMN